MHRRDLIRLMSSAALAPALHGRPESPRAPRHDAAYGSGHFGEWMDDEWGAPAYRYTCDQLTDPKAVAPTDPIFCGATDQWHQLGNDRLVVKASNFGYMQVRQDEGNPKFLNDYIPEEGEFGGGIGFLSDGDHVVSSYYCGHAERFDRVFGLGYYRKTVTAHGYTIDQTVFAPYGDDPVLITKVTIRRHTTVRGGGDANARLRWTEYWGCRPYEFCGSDGDVCTQTETHFQRRIFGKRFRHNFEALLGGLVERKQYLHPESEYPIGANGRRARDITPPATFLIPLGDEPSTVTADSFPFFGEGGVAAPQAARRALNGRLAAFTKIASAYDVLNAARPALLMQREFELQPGESRTLHSLYGYLTAEQSAEPLVAKYRASAASTLPETVKTWAQDGLRLSTAGEPWVEREAAWSNYYLRSNVTYDEIFEEHFVSQAGAYLYLNGPGRDGGGRDSPLHAMPLIFSRPEQAKATLRYCLKERYHNAPPLREDGSPVDEAGHFLMDSAPSDVALWHLWLASEYVLGTRDRAVFDEEIPTYPKGAPNAQRYTVRELLARLDQSIRGDIGVGPHGLLRIRGGDWNDNLLLSHCPNDQRKVCQEMGESMMSAAMAGYIFDRYAALHDYLGSAPHEAGEMRAFARSQREAVTRQWTGRWYRRAWLGPKAGWMGEEPSLWLEPQPWAIISGAAGPERAKQLSATLTRLLRDPSPIGAMHVNAESQDSDPLDRGVAEEGGVWPALNVTLIWALAQVDGDAAWDEWKKNTLARHAEAYPGMWCGILSGPDTYNGVLSQFPGQAMVSDLIRKPGTIIDHVYSRDFGMTDFPVMNMHPHAVPLLALTKLIGAEFTVQGVTLRPVLPLAAYRFTSPLLGLERSADGYAGWYDPPAAHGPWTIQVQLPPEEAARISSLAINGAAAPVRRASAAEFVICGEGGAGRRLQWKLSMSAGAP